MAPKKENEGRKGRKPPTNRIDVKRTPMSERQKLFSECDEDLCSVCWNEVGPGLRSFAVGAESHGANSAIAYLAPPRRRKTAK